MERERAAAGGAGNQTPVWSDAPGAATKWSAQGDGGEDGVVDGWMMWSSEVAEARW